MVHFLQLRKLHLYEEEENHRDKNDGTTTIYCWSTSIQPSKEFSEWMNVSDENDDADDDDRQEERVVQQMGIYCTSSGQFQISCRFFGSHGPGNGDGTVGLSKVSWIRGTAELAIERATEMKKSVTDETWK